MPRKSSSLRVVWNLAAVGYSADISAWLGSDKKINISKACLPICGHNNFCHEILKFPLGELPLVGTPGIKVGDL